MFMRFIAALFSVSLLISPVAAFAESDPIYTTKKSNVAADGYDVLSFFSGEPQVGNASFSTEYEGATWYFVSEANRDEFVSNPSAFAPQYGGYCAWALAKNKLARGNPKYWHVEDGRLYFNYNARIQRKWDKKRGEFIEKADGHWPTVLDK